MGRTARSLAGILLGGLGMAAAVLAADGADGRVVGRVTRPDGTSLAGVQVSISELSLATVTDAAGDYVLEPVPAGHHDVEFRLGSASDLTAVDVGAGQEIRLDRSPDWGTAFAETITVVSASRRAERITEAPAAVTLVPAEEIQKIAATGQVPKILEFTPGAEVTQSGIYDFNLNTRGFNSSLNRRVAVLIDGREPSVPFLGAQEWASMPFPLDDLQEAELVRGPSAALYGANASSGVLNLITKRPRGSEGGLVRLTGGELSTFNGDLRWAGHLGGSWWGKVDGGIRKSGDFTVSRNGQAEYSVPCTVRGQTDCLPQEVVPLDPLNDDDVKFGLARLDRYWNDGSFSTFEAGLTKIQGPVFQTGIGRVQVVDADRSWFRLDHSMKNWNFLITENGRDAPKQTALATGNNVALDDKNWKGEIEGWWSFFGDKLRLVSGMSYKDERIDSVDTSGPTRPSLLKRGNQQTLLFEPLQENFTAVYGQLDWAATDRLKVVVAGRYDESTLHDPQISPKAALVFTLAPNHSLRLTYNEAFQVPNYSEYFLQADVAAPINLSPFETLCFQQGVSCGFNLDNDVTTGDTRVLALGNENLKLEKVKTAEIGYTGVLGGKAMLTANYYFSRNEDFITDLLPQLGTAFGRINPDFGPYQTPRCKGSDGVVKPCLPAPVDAQLLALLQQALGPSFALLSNNVDGTPILAAVSYTNFGRVDTQGLEVGLNWQPTTRWGVDFSYAYFQFDIKDSSPGLDGLLLPNSPENTASVAVTYTGTRFDASASYRWSDAFRWAVGPFQGDVPAYGILDLQAEFDFTRHVGLGLNVANALDEQHWEAFGGDLLGRRALGSLTFRW
jgi:outer membrane receptor protein involved in Fe transport